MPSSRCHFMRIMSSGSRPLHVRGRRVRCRLVLRCWLSRGRCGLLLLLLFFLGHVMAHCAAGGSAQDRMMAGHVSRYGTDRGALEAAFGDGALIGDQE
jgi:hypothetical protein